MPAPFRLIHFVRRTRAAARTSRTARSGLRPADALGDVGEAEQEAGDVVALHHQLDQLRVGDLQQPLADHLGLALRDRVELPVVHEGVVVGLHDARDPGRSSFLLAKVLMVKPRRAIIFSAMLAHALGAVRVARQVGREEVALAAVAGAFDQLAVVRRGCRGCRPPGDARSHRPGCRCRRPAGSPSRRPSWSDRGLWPSSRSAAKSACAASASSSASKR